MQYPTDGKPTLRDPKTQVEFKRAALDNGIQICSLAIGNPGKQRLPMHTNPAFAILLAEAVEIAYNIGTNNILLPILGDSHIDMTNQAQVDGFVTMMKEVARYAEKYDVVVGLEDWISAADNIKLLDAIGSDYVAVYYDAHNIVSRIASDIYAEPKMLGKRINQIHVKNAEHAAGDAGRQDGLAADGEGVLRYRLPRVVRARNRVADEGPRRRHAGQHRVREEDVPDASAIGDLSFSWTSCACHRAQRWLRQVRARAHPSLGRARLTRREDSGLHRQHRGKDAAAGAARKNPHSPAVRFRDPARDREPEARAAAACARHRAGRIARIRVRDLPARCRGQCRRPVTGRHRPIGRRE